MSGCEWDEGRLALRLYWRSHSRILFRLGLILFGSSIILFMASMVVSLPGIPVGLTTAPDWFWETTFKQPRLYPHVFLPILAVVTLYLTPRLIYFPTCLSPPSIQAARMVWTVGLASLPQLAYYASWYFQVSFHGADLFIAGYNRIYLPLIILFWFIAGIAPIAILYSLNNWLKPNRTFNLIAATWLACHIALNCLSWMKAGGIEEGNLYGIDPVLMVGRWGLLILVVQIGLYCWRPVRRIVFVFSALIFTLIHLFGFLMLKYSVSGYFLLLSYSGLLSIGLPPSAWTTYTCVYQ